MRRLLSSRFVAFLSVALHCGCALGEEWANSDDLFDLQEQDLFSNAFDTSSVDIATSEDPSWASSSSSSLQPIDAYMSEKTVFSSPSSSSEFLSSADQSSACLAEADSSSLFGRSDDWPAGDNYIATSSPDFCLQNPDKPSTEIPPPITLPNLFDLLHQPDLDDLAPPPPLDIFPRRPVCAGLNPYHVLCCHRDRERQTGSTWDCEKCMYYTVQYMILSQIFLLFRFVPPPPQFRKLF